MERCFILGGDSLIGKVLINKLENTGSSVTSTTRKVVNVDDSRIYFDLSSSVLKPDRYDISFLCAGITNMAVCEAEPQYTYSINVDATVSAAKVLLEAGSRVVFISSNTVFNGTVAEPDENTPYSHSTEYGRQKAETERQLLNLGAGVAIIRITKLVSPMNALFSNIVMTLKANQKLTLFDDLYISPISLGYLIDGMLTISRSSLDGIFHLSGVENLSYAELGRAIARMLKVDTNLIQDSSVTSVLFKPQYASLGMKRTSQLLSLQPELSNSVFSTLI